MLVAVKESGVSPVRISRIFIAPILALIVNYAGTANASDTSAAPTPGAPEAGTLPGSATAEAQAASPFLNAFPQLKPYVYEEPPSGFYLGVGLSPVGLLKDRFMLTLDMFQLHWMNDKWDVEILNAAYSVTRAQSSAVQSTQFTARSTVKYRFFKNFSVGPLVGYEFVSFPNITAQLQKGNLFSPSEPFSSRGWIYGGMLTETFKMGGGSYLLQINELAYKQTYSTSQTAEGWNYYYNDATIRNDPSQIQAGFVMMIEASFLY